MAATVSGIRATDEIVPETIRGQPANALHFVRAGGNVDSDLIGIKQTAHVQRAR